jgi:hypothetical protein
MKRSLSRTATSLAAGLLLSGLAGLALAQDARRPYIVQLQEAATASYSGGISGLAATRPAAGSRLDLSASAVRDYIAYIENRQSAVLSTLPTVSPIHRFSIAFNGFSAMLTDAEVRQLKGNPGVLAVEEDVPRQLDTNYTPTFIGLNQPGGLWDQLGGPAKAGEDIVIGVIDGGVWPENTAFADRVDARPLRQPGLRSAAGHLAGRMRNQREAQRLPDGACAGVHRRQLQQQADRRPCLRPDLLEPLRQQRAPGRVHLAA